MFALRKSISVDEKIKKKVDRDGQWMDKDKLSERDRDSDRQ